MIVSVRLFTDLQTIKIQQFGKCSERNMAVPMYQCTYVQSHKYETRQIRPSENISATLRLQRVLALCYFWDLEKVTLAKNVRSNKINSP